MPRCIVKIDENKYIEWTTVCDAPTTFIMNRDEMLSYLNAQDSERSFDENRKRLDRADLHGTSFHAPTSLKQIISGNRAGKDEKEITIDQIIEKYSRPK